MCFKYVRTRACVFMLESPLVQIRPVWKFTLSSLIFYFVGAGARQEGLGEGGGGGGGVSGFEVPVACNCNANSAKEIKVNW